MSRKNRQAMQRLNFEQFGISQRRYLELRNGCRMRTYSPEMLSRACSGFEFVKPWILLSVTENRSFDRLEFHATLGRCPVSRTDFYGYRRLFYHNLDCILQANGERLIEEIERT